MDIDPERDSAATVPDELSDIDRRLDAGERRMRVIEARLLENCAATKRIERNTSDLVEAFQALTGAFKVLGWFGKAAKPLGYIAAAVAACVSVWAAIKGGLGPK